MCRIAGIINPNLPAEHINRMVAQMCSLQEHGGPDDEGVYSNASCSLVLGHRRLSIIDSSSAGHQPMSYKEGRFVITYNGEIYNYQVLKADLKSKGHCFTTECDTEVILAAYAEWGVGAFEKLEGMFAFAIWDNRERELIMARDASGIKPLYYAHTKEGFAFASEVRALKSIGYLARTNEKWPVFLMAYGHLPEPVTTLADVQPLQKGVFLRYRPAEEKITYTHFKRQFFVEKITNRAEAISLIKQKLDKAVQKHLIADVPVGVFLSGGLDSGILTLLANRHQQKLNTISIYFDNHRYSEKKYQDELQKELSCNHHQFLLTETEFHEKVPSILQAMDLPCCDGINTWFISKLARKSGIKAVLSGVGGDELFGGYPSFKRIGATPLLEKIPSGFFRSGSLSKAKQVRRLCYLSIPGAVGRYLFLRGQFVPADIAAFLNMDEKKVWEILEEQPELPDIKFLTPANQAGWLEINMYMQNQLLRDADVMGMAHGVEIRVPFLDKDFMQLVMSVSSKVKYSGKHSKQLLIDSFKDILPTQVWNRPKMGFSFPFKEWFGSNNYNRAGNTDLSVPHKKFTEGKMHWSQFFTIYLIHTYQNGQ